MTLDGTSRVVLVGGAKNEHPLSDVMTKSGGFTDLLLLGTPVVADVDRIVTSVDMQVGEYTIAAQPDVPRNITVTRTVVTAADTPGTITVTGTNINDEAISEVITPGATGVTVAGTKAFKSVASVVGEGWVIDTDEDTITVGVGGVLGLPYATPDADQVKIGIVGTSLVAPTVVADATVEESTVDLSSGTYDGSKKVWVFYAWA